MELYDMAYKQRVLGNQEHKAFAPTPLRDKIHFRKSVEIR
jgi:hypothetical protein